MGVVGSRRSGRGRRVLRVHGPLTFDLKREILFFWLFVPVLCEAGIVLAALKDATRRLRRWPRERARPSLTAATRLAWGCSGRDEKTALQPNQKTGVAAEARRTTHALQTADIFTRHRHWQRRAGSTAEVSAFCACAAICSGRSAADVTQGRSGKLSHEVVPSSDVLAIAMVFLTSFFLTASADNSNRLRGKSSGASPA